MAAAQKQPSSFSLLSISLPSNTPFILLPKYSKSPTVISIIHSTHKIKRITDSHFYSIMDKAPSTVIEVTVISAEGLLMNRRQPVKKNAFVVIRSDPFNFRSTGMDPHRGSCPSWNEKLVMELPVHVRFITVEAHSGNKVIGSANIPVTDFSGGFLPENSLSFLSYRLRNASGEKNGIVNLSVKVRGGSGKSGLSASCARPWMGFPVENKVTNGFVTGIPVLYR